MKSIKINHELRSGMRKAISTDRKSEAGDAPVVKKKASEYKKVFKGSGIFTSEGIELPQITDGYDFIQTNGAFDR